MTRFILRFTGQGVPPEADLTQIRSAPGVTVLDSASPRMLLVQGSPETLGQLAKALPGWVYNREHAIPVPDPRPKIRSS
jgi:hypothetical protein